jgi:homoserine dehydrogenase
MRTVRVGLLGCGVVGGGVVQLLAQHRADFEARLGATLEIVKIAVRSEDKDRVTGVPREVITTDVNEVVNLEGLDVLVEVMGGVHPAYECIKTALARGVSVVTANKMLLAERGPELLAIARERGSDLAFEAAVGGGIPVIRVFRDSLASDSVEKLAGIVNGTCNFVLTRMRDDGASFAEALADAQARGYAEADPTLDVDGHDAAHKLVVLAMLAFGAEVDHAHVPTEGIRALEPVDHTFAARFGYAIKHLAIGRDRGNEIELRVHPALVRRETPLANVSGVLNAVALEGKALGPLLLSGRGAGAFPTAVSVVADILDAAKGRLAGHQGSLVRGIHLAKRPLASMDSVTTRYYLRFPVRDEPGVLSTLTGKLGERGVSIEQMVQDGRADDGKPVQVVLTTHEAKEQNIREALAAIEAQSFSLGATRVLRIEQP